MPIPAPRPEATEDPWVDAEGTPIPLQSWVEQIVVDVEQVPRRINPSGVNFAGVAGSVRSLTVATTDGNRPVYLLPW